MKQKVLIDERASKEIYKLPKNVQLKFQALLEVLEETGKLEEPFGKKIAGEKNLFEIRVKYEGQWRAIYAYLGLSEIIVLSAFSKKVQKTPKTEIKKAKQRLKNYL